MMPTTFSRKFCVASCLHTKSTKTTETIAFMDIMPRCEGHTLVVPKSPARNLLDANASPAYGLHEDGAEGVSWRS